MQSVTTNLNNMQASSRSVRQVERIWMMDRWANVTLIVYVLIGLWFSLVTPPFETPDEIYHYAFARHLAQGNVLPIQDEGASGPWQHEGSQAPLYYLLTGRLTAGIDQSDFEALSVTNPRSNMGDPLYPGNKNRMLYSTEWLPLQGTNLALHVGRWFSLLLGTMSLWLIYRTAHFAFARNGWLPLLVMVVVAAMPQYLYISASFSNDNMIILASTAVVYWLARLLATEPLLDGKYPPVQWWAWWIMGVLLGIAALSKLQGLGLFLLAAMTGLGISWRQRDWWLPFRAFLPVALPAIAIAGWWYWRNYTIYDDWTGFNHLIAINGLRPKPLDWDDWGHELRGLRYSFWGLFGWFNILLPTWIYTVLDWISAVGLIGMLLGFYTSWRRERSAWIHRSEVQVRLLLVGWMLFSALQFFYWMSRATGTQGRLLFPTITSIAVLLVYGLHFWVQRLPQRLQMAILALFPTLLLGTSLYAVSILTPAAYAAPRPLAKMPAGVQPVEIYYGGKEDNEGWNLALVGIEVPNRRFRPGESVPITLYHSARTPLNEDYELFIQLLDETSTPIANLTSHPGWGKHPTTLWKPDVVYADHYDLWINRDIDPTSPLLARLYTGFIDPATTKSDLTPIVARTPAGEEILPVPAAVVVEPRHPAELAAYALNDVGTHFGDVITLAGAHIPREIAAGDTMTVTLFWEGTGIPATDYIAFVHLLDADGARVAGYDDAPAGDRFPTPHWQAGDHVVSQFPIILPADLPPGDYELWAGLYETASQGVNRLPISDAAGQEVAHNTVHLGSPVILSTAD